MCVKIHQRSRVREVILRGKLGILEILSMRSRVLKWTGKQGKFHQHRGMVSLILREEELPRLGGTSQLFLTNT